MINTLFERNGIQWWERPHLLEPTWRSHCTMGSASFYLQISFYHSSLWKYSLRWDSLVNPEPSQKLPLAWECTIASNDGLASLVSQCFGVYIQALLSESVSMGQLLNDSRFPFTNQKKGGIAGYFRKDEMRSSLQNLLLCVWHTITAAFPGGCLFCK